MTTSNKTRGALLGLLTAVFTAGYLLCFRAAPADRSAITFAIVLWAAIFNSGLTLTRIRTTPRPNRSWLVSAVFLATMTVVGNIALGVALDQLGAGVASTMMQLQIFFVGIGAWIFLKERVSLALALGAVLAVAGFVTFALPSSSSASLPAWGLFCGTTTALCFSGMMIWTRAVIRDLDPVSLNAGRLWIGVIAMALWPGLLAKVFSMPLEAWLLAMAAAAMGPFIGRLCVMYSLRFISAAETKLWGMLSPVFAFFLVYIIYGQTPSIREVTGGLLIIGGVVFPTLLGLYALRANRPSSEKSS